MQDSVALRITDRETLRLVDEVAAMTGETKTEVIRRSLEERLLRLKGLGGPAFQPNQVDQPKKFQSD